MSRDDDEKLLHEIFSVDEKPRRPSSEMTIKEFYDTIRSIPIVPDTKPPFPEMEGTPEVSYDYALQMTILKRLRDYRYTLERLIKPSHLYDIGTNVRVAVKALVDKDYKCRLAHSEIANRGEVSFVLVFDNGGSGFVYLAIQASNARLWAGSSSAEDLAGLGTIFESFQETERVRDEDEDVVSVDFSYLNGSGRLQRKTRNIKTARMEDYHYPAISRQLDGLFQLENPWDRGKIILWHGPPGTGKTTAIRALFAAWRDQMDYVVINDPDRFFGDPAYMNAIAADNDGNDGDKPVLIVIEDSADLYSLRCRENPGFARLLNISDGLMGQGRRLVFLFTANEALDAIDPAIMRPGRLLQELHFDHLSREQAKAWFDQHDLSESFEEFVAARESRGNFTLAEMFAWKNGNHTVQLEAERSGDSFGF